MKPRHAVALALVGCYLMLPLWVVQNIDAQAPLSKWQKSGKFGTEAAWHLDAICIDRLVS